MHIAFVTADPGIPVFGCKGASVHIQEIVRAFLALGANITLMSPRLEGTPPADLADVTCIELPICDARDPVRRAQQSIAANTVMDDVLESLAPCDLIYERHSLFTDAPMRFAARNHIPCVLEVNAPLIAEQMKHRNLPMASEARLRASHALSAASVVTVVSSALIHYVTSLGADDQHVHVLENAVNPARFPPTSRPDGPFTVGFLGTLKPWHDAATLIEGFAILRLQGIDARLLIVGDGPERGKLEAQVDRLYLNAVVEFAGMKRPDEIPGQLARMHVAVAPYRQDEGFYFSPLKVYEYMAAGLPVVASRVGHLASLVTHEQTGLLCAPEHPQVLANTLMRLADEPETASRLGRNAREEVIALHDWNSVASRVLTLATSRNDLTAVS